MHPKAKKLLFLKKQQEKKMAEAAKLAETPVSEKKAEEVKLVIEPVAEVVVAVEEVIETVPQAEEVLNETPAEETKPAFSKKKQKTV